MAEQKRRRRRSTSTTAKKEPAKEPAKESPRRRRSTQRIESTDAKDNKAPKHRVDRVRGGGVVEYGVLIGDNGLPMMKIVNQGAETVPVAQYANVIVGPVSVERWASDPGVHEIVGVNPDDYTDEQSAIAQRMKEEIAAGQSVLEEVIAEDRELIEESIRKQNEEEEKSK